MFGEQRIFEDCGTMLSDEWPDPTVAISALTDFERTCFFCGHITMEDPPQIISRIEEKKALLLLLCIDPDGSDQDIRIEVLRCMVKDLTKG